MDHELGRRLDQAAVVRVGRKFRTGEDGAHQSLHVVLAVSERVGEVLDVARTGSRRHEMYDYLAGNQLRRRWLGKDPVQHSLCVEGAGLAEEGDGVLLREASVE